MSTSALDSAAAPAARQHVVRRDGLVVDGPDALVWLQGQVTQDLDGMEDGDERLSLVLSPQGKLVSFVRVTRLERERVLLDTEHGFGGELEERLRRFKFRVKATIEPVTVERAQTSGGWDGMGPPTVGGSGAEPALDFEFERILAGVPKMGAELTESTIPQEAGDEFVRRTVSFTKGCYTGQELVARVDARGSNVPRRLRVVRGGGAEAETPSAGDHLHIGDADIGTLTSVAADPNRQSSWAALAMIKRSALQPDSFVADLDGHGTSTGQSATVLPNLG